MVNLVGRYINGEYFVDRVFGQGGFGIVYMGMDRQRNEVVIKVDKYPNMKTVENEVRIYQLLSNSRGFPELYYHGYFESYPLMVMERLGDSLRTELSRTKYGFYSSTVVMIGIELLYRLEDLHDVGYVHRDLKPQNVVLGRKTTYDGQRTLYLIDLGAAGRFKDDCGRHIRDGSAEPAVAGTPWFAPVRWHERKRQSRRDDLESLAYMLVYLYYRKLPWTKPPSQHRSNHSQSICQQKKQISACTLFDGLPEEMVSFYEEIKQLRFEDRPNYRHLRGILRSVLRGRGECDERSFEWIRTR